VTDEDDVDVLTLLTVDFLQSGLVDIGLLCLGDGIGSTGSLGSFGTASRARTSGTGAAGGRCR
jgi:hypothetical protein